jgi:dienelactone hydrolase
VLELARTGADVKAVVGFHPGLGVARTDAAGVDWRMNLDGGALHSFTNPYAARFPLPGLAYDQATDERSWRAMLDLFDEVFA